jgi:hypothetical protein
MKYENAGDVLPEQLLREIQRYAAGKLLYVPARADKRAWGESSGYREQLQKRNRMIRNKYAHGMTVSELADEYFLSLDSIKKIIYSKSIAQDITYSPTIASAVQYANAGMLEEWMQCYCLLTGKAAPLAEDLANGAALYFGVVKFPLRLIRRERTDNGESIAARDFNTDGFASPPLLVRYEEGKFYDASEQDLLASLRHRKMNAYPAIIALNGNAEYKTFMNEYGNVLIYATQ